MATAVPQREIDRRADVLMQRCEEQDYAGLAVAALRRAGIHAWKNEIGHVAVGV